VLSIEISWDWKGRERRRERLDLIAGCSGQRLTTNLDDRGFAAVWFLTFLCAIYVVGLGLSQNVSIRSALESLCDDNTERPASHQDGNLP
jgi:hypothetical protein